VRLKASTDRLEGAGIQPVIEQCHANHALFELGKIAVAHRQAAGGSFGQA